MELAGIYVRPLCVLRPFRRCLSWMEDFQVLSLFFRKLYSLLGE